MFAFISNFFAMLSNFVSGTNSYVNAYNEAGKWCEKSMQGFNSIADVEREIKLAKLKRELNAQQAQLTQQPE